MDTVTHGLTGWLIARAVPTEKWGREAKAAVVLGSVLPDADMAASLLSSDLYVRLHRGISHSFLGVAATSLLVALLFHRFGRWKNPKGLFLLVLAGQLFHILLDLLNAYGTQIFQPFSDARISFDLLFVVDLVFSGIVLSGILLSRRRARPGPARAAFAVLALYVGVATLLHFRAERTVAEAAARSGVKVADAWALPRLGTVTIPSGISRPWSFAFAAPAWAGLPGVPAPSAGGTSVPLPAGPLAWNGFVDDGKTWLRAEVDPVAESLVWKDRVLHGQDAPGVVALRGLPDVRTYMWFARFPFAEVSRSGGDNVILFSDLRYAGMAGRRPFCLRIVSGPGRRPSVDWCGKE